MIIYYPTTHRKASLAYSQTVFYAVQILGKIIPYIQF